MPPSPPFVCDSIYDPYTVKPNIEGSFAARLVLMRASSAWLVTSGVSSR